MNSIQGISRYCDESMLEMKDKEIMPLPEICSHLWTQVNFCCLWALSSNRIILNQYYKDQHGGTCV